jgi:hypothetical protein
MALRVRGYIFLKNYFGDDLVDLPTSDAQTMHESLSSMAKACSPIGSIGSLDACG